MSATPRKSRFLRILSLDGGGVRGIIPATLLLELERRLREQSGRTDARLADYFDFVAGTSTGGLLTLMYLAPDTQKRRPRFSAEQVLEFYSTKVRNIFERSYVQSVRHAWGYAGPEYSPKNFESLLFSITGDLCLSDLTQACLITSFDIGRSKPHFFTNRIKYKHHRDGRDDVSQPNVSTSPPVDFLLRDVARATSAAPTYFPPAQISSVHPVQQYTLIDGGVFANNPSLCAYAEARNLRMQGFTDPSAADMFVLSLSCGTQSAALDTRKALDWGALHWAEPLIDIMMCGSSQTVDYQLREVFRARQCESQYVRLDCPLTASDRLDDCSAANLQALQADAAKFLANAATQRTLEHVVRCLTAPPEPPRPPADPAGPPAAVRCESTSAISSDFVIVSSLPSLD